MTNLDESTDWPTRFCLMILAKIARPRRDRSISTDCWSIDGLVVGPGSAGVQRGRGCVEMPLGVSSDRRPPSSRLHANRNDGCSAAARCHSQPKPGNAPSHASDKPKARLVHKKRGTHRIDVHVRRVDVDEWASLKEPLDGRLRMRSQNAKEAIAAHFRIRIELATAGIHFVR